MDYTVPLEPSDYEEDMQSLLEPCFDAEPYWNMEIDLASMCIDSAIKY